MKDFVLDRMVSEIVTMQALAFQNVQVTKKVLSDKMNVNEVPISCDLRELISRGIISMEGSRRTAYYIITPKALEKLNSGVDVKSLIETGFPKEFIKTSLSKKNIDKLKDFRNLLKYMEDLEEENELLKSKVIKLQSELDVINNKVNKLKDLL